MANRYWVGGTGTWNSSSTTNWSTSSGGSSGASVPTPSDSVFFDQAGTYTVTMTGILNCLNITTSTGTVTFATGTGPQLFISGSMTLVAGTVWNSTGTITFNATTSQTITTNSTTLTPNINFNGLGGTWTLGSALTTGTNALTTLVAGTIDLSGFTFTTGIFSSSNTNTRSISFGTGNIALSITSAGVNNLLMTNATNFTLTGTGGFTASASVARIFTFGTTGGSITNSPNLTFTGSGTSSATITTGSWFNKLDFGTTAFTIPSTALKLASLTLSSSGTFTGLTVTLLNTGTITSNGNTTLPINGINVNHTGTTSLGDNFTMSTTSSFALTAGTLNLNGFNLSTGIFSCTGTSVRSITFGSNNIVLTHPTTATTVLIMDNATNFTLTGTGGFTASASVARIFTFGTTGGSATNSPKLSFTGSASVTQTITTGSYFNILDFGTTGFTLDITTLNLNSLTLSVLGDYSLLTANMVGTGTITPNGKSIGVLTINHSGITTIASVATTYKTFTYAGSGSITFPAVNSPPTVESLVIAGGGAGGGLGGGGGGAGGMLRGGFSPVAGAQYTITVGTGGIAFNSTTSSGNGGYGVDSSITGTGVSLTATGGGYGSQYSSVTIPQPGGSGGSGGGAGGASVFPGTLSSAGGSGTVGQGFDGGSTLNSTESFKGSGGGGAGSVGAGLNAPGGGTASGNGGVGLLSGISGTLVYYAGGGGGGQTSNAPGTGGLGGGGLGGSSGGTPGTNGTANTGGGGGGGGSNNPIAGAKAGAGGSGIVILRYPSTYADPSATTGTPTVTSTTDSFTVLGTTTLTSGALNLNGPLLTSIFNSDNTNTRSISFGTNNITLVSPTDGTVVLDMPTATGFTYTGTGGFTADASVRRTYRFGSTAGGSITNSPNLSLTGAPASTQTFTTGSWFNTLNFGTVNSTVSTTNLNLNNLTLSSGGTYTGLSATMVGTGTITNNGRTIAGLTINNGAGTTTLTGALSCTTYTQTAGTIDFATFNLTCSSTATYTAGTLSNLSTISCTTWTCVGTFTLTSGTINPNTFVVSNGFTLGSGGTLGSVQTFTHTAGTVTFGKAYSLTGTGVYTLTAGTLDLNGFNLTTGRFSSSNTNTRSITFGSNNIILSTTIAALTNLDMASATGFTYTGTGGFTAAADITRTFTFGTGSTGTATTSPELTFTGAGTAIQTLSSASWFKTLDFGSTAFAIPTTSLNINNLNLSSGGTFTGLTAQMVATGTVTPNSNTTLGNLTIDGVGITTSLAAALTLTATGTITLTNGTLDLNGFNLTTGIFSSNNANTRGITFGTNNIILATTTASATNLDMANATGFTYTGTGGFTAAADIIRGFTFGTTGGSATNSPNLTFTGSGALVPIITTGSWFNKLDFGTTTFNAPNVSVNVNSMTLSSGGFYTFLSFVMRGTGTITPNGKTINNFDILHAGTTTFAGALGCGLYTQSSGDVNFATFNLTCSSTATYTAGTLSNIGTISCTTWTCAGTFTLTSGTITPSTSFVVTGAFNYNGGTLSAVPTFTHTSGTVTLGKAYALTATGAYTLTAGTLDLAGFTLTTGTFSSNNSNTRSISFGTGNIVLATTTAAQTNLSMATATGFTYTGTGGFTAAADTTRTFTFGTTGGSSTIAPNLTFTGSGISVLTITTASWFNTLNFGTTAFTLPTTSLNLNALTLSSGAGVYTGLTATMVGTGTITPNSKTIAAFTVNHAGTTTLAGALGCTTYTQTAGTINFATFNLTCSSTATYNDNGGTLSNIGTISCTTWTCAGIFTLTSGTINCSTSFVTTGSVFGGLNYNGGTITTNTFTQTSGNVTLGAAFTLASTCTYTLTSGTLSLNGFNLSTGFFATAGASGRTVAFSTNNITLTGASGTVLSMAVLGGFTYTGTGGFTADASVVRTYSVGSTSGGTATNAPNLSFTGSGTAIPVLTTASWFGTLNFGTTAFTLAATTLNLNNFTLSTTGTYTNLSATMVGTGTPNFNGKAIAGFVINNGAVTGTTTLAAAVSCTTLTLTSGTLDSASFNITPSTTVTFNGNTTLTNTGTITCTTWTVSAGTFTMTNGTITPSTSFVVSGGNFNYNGGTLSAVSTFTHTSGGVSFGKAYSLTATGTYTFTAGALTLNGFDLTTGIFSSSGTGSRTVTFGTNNIILAHTTAGTTVLAMNDISNFFNDVSTGGFVGDASVTRTYTIGVTASAFVIPTGFANLSITGSGTAVQTITTGSRVRSLNFGSTAFTLPTTSITFYSGGLTLSSGGTYTNLTATFNTAAGYTSCIVTPNGKTIGPLVITSGTVTLAGALGCTTYTQTAGGIDFATFNLTCSSSVAYTAGTLSNVGTITCTTWTVTGAFTMTNGTITPSTSFVLTSGAFNYNGGTLSPVPTFTQTAGTVTLGKAYALSATGTYTLTAGTLNLNGFDLTTGIFSSSGTGVRSITFGTNNIILAHTTAGTTVLAMADASSFTYTGTGGFTTDASVTRTFDFAGSLAVGGSTTNAPNLSITSGSAVPTFTGASWFKALNFTGSSTTPALTGGTTGILIDTLTLSTGGTYTGLIPIFTRTQTWTPQFSKQLGGMGIQGTGVTLTFGAVQSFTATSVFNFSSGTLDLGGYDLTIGQFFSTTSTVRSIIFGTNNIVLSTTTAAQTNLSFGNATGFTYTGTGGFTAAADITRTFTFGTTAGSTTNAPNLIFTGSGTAVQTLTTGSWFNVLNFGTTAFDPGTTALNVNSLTLSSSGTYATVTPTMRGTGTITPNGKTLAALTINTTGTVTLGGVVTYALATATTTLTSGTLDLNGNNLTTGIFSSSSAVTRSIIFGSNNIILATTTAATNVLNMGTVTGFTYTGTGGFTAAADITRTYTFGTAGGSATNAPNLTLTGSGTAIQTITTGSWFNTLNFGTTAFAIPTTTVNVVNITLSSGGTYTALTINMVGSGTITTNGKPIAALNFTGSGTTTLGSSLTLPTTTVTTLTSGTLNLNGFDLTTGTFSSNNSNVRSILFGVGNIILTTATAATLNLDMATITNFTWTGTGGFRAAADITRTYTVGSTAGSSASAPNLAITSGAAVPTFTDGSWFNQLDFTGTTSTPAVTASVLGINVSTLTLATGGTYTSLIPVFTRTQTWSMQQSKQLGGIGVNGLGVTLTLDNTQTYTATAPFILAQGTLDLGGVNLTIGTFISNNANTRSISFGSNNIILATTTAAATNLDMANATGFTYTGTGGFTAAADITRTYTFGTTGGSATNSPNLTFTGTGTAIPTLTTTSWFNTLNFGTTVFVLGVTSLNLNGLTLSASGTFSTLTPTFVGTGTIISNGNATLPSLTINSVSGITTLGSSLTLGTTIVTTLTSGTLALGIYTLTTGIFSSNVANTRSINFGTGNIALVYSIAGGVSLSMATATGFTYTGTGGFTSNMTVQRGFRFGNVAGGSISNAPNLSLTAGAGEALITSSWFNTFNCNGFTGTVSGSTTASATTLNLNNLTLSSGGTYTNLTAVMRSTGSIDGVGKSISALTIDYTGTCTLASALTVVNTTTLGGTLSPTLNLNGFDLTTASFSSTNAIARTITFGSNYIVITSTLNMDVADNFTWTGTTGFKANANNQTITFGNISGASASNAINLFVPSGSATVFLTANSWFNKIDCTGSTGNVGTSSVITARPINVNNLILSATAIAGAYDFLQVNFYGTTSTLNGQGKSIYNLSIPSGGTTTLQSALGFTAAYTQVANTTLDLAGFTLTAAAGFTYTDGTISNFGTISTTTYTHNGPTFTLNSGAINCSVSFVLSVGSFTLGSLGSLGVTPTFTHNAGTFTLGKNYALTATGTYTFNAGTINLAGFTLSTGTFSSSVANTRSIDFSTGNIDLTHTTSGTTSLSMQTATGFTYTGTGGFTSNMTVQRGFRFGSTGGGTATNAPNLSLTGGAFEALIATGSWFNTLNCTGSTSTISGSTTASATTLNLANLTLATGGTYTNLTAIMSTPGTISGVGKSIAALSIDYTGTCTLASALTVVNTTTFGGTLSPTLNLNGFDLTTASFSSSNLIARTVTFGSNYIVITSTLSMDVANNFTWTGTGGFSASANNQSISFGNTSGASASNAINLFVPSGSLTLFLTTNSWFNKIDCTGSTGNVGTSSVTTARTIFTNNLILSATAIAGAYSYLQVNFYGTNSTINGQGKSIYNLSIPSGGTTTLQSALGFTVAYVQVANTTLDLAGYTLTSTSTIEYVAGTLANTGTITCTTWTCTGTFTLTSGAINPSLGFVVTGSFTLGSGASWGAVPTFDHISGTVTLGKAYALTVTGTYSFTAGTINLAGFTLTTGIFSSSGAVARNISFGSGNIDLTHTTSGAQVIQMTTMTGFTWTGTGGFTTNMSTIRQFRVGATSGASASNAFNLTLTGGTNEALIYTGSWFNTLNCTNSSATISGSTTASATSLNLAGLFLNVSAIYTNLTATLVTSGVISGTNANPPILIINHTGTTTLAGAFSCSSYTQTAGDVNFGGYNFTSIGAIAYTAGTYTNTGTISCTTFTVTGNFTFSNGTLTPSTSFVLSSGSFTYSGGTLTALALFTLTSGTVTLTGRDITTSTFSSTGAGVRSISFGTNNIIINTLSMANATNFTYTGTGGFISDATGTSRVFTFGTTGGSATNSPNLTFTSGSLAQTLTTGSWFNTLNFGTTVFNPGTTALNLNGLTLASGGTYSTLTPTFVGTGTITTNNNTTLPSLTINSVSGTTSLGGAVSFATNVITTLTSGTLNLNGYNLTTGQFSSSNSNTRSISFGNNNIILAFNSPGATNLSMTIATGFTYTGTGGFTAAADITRIYVFGTTGGNSTNSPNLTLTGSGTAIQTLTTGSYFNNLNFGTTAFTLAVTTQNVNGLTLSSGGTFTNLSVTTVGTGTITTNGKTIAAFNVNTGGTTTLGGDVTCTTYTQTAGTLDLAGYTINASGAISYIAGTLVNYTTITGASFAVTGTFTLTSGTLNVPIFTVTSGTFNYYGGTLTSVTTFTQTSGTVVLGANLTLASTCTYTFTADTLSLAGFTLTTGIFSSNNVNVRSILFGAGSIALVHTTAAQTVLAMVDATNFNYTGTGGFVSDASVTRTYTFGTSGGSFYNAPNLSITSGASTQTFTDGSYFKLLDFTGTTSTVAVTASVLGISVDTLTLATGGTYISLIPVFTRTQTWTSQYSKQLGGIGVNRPNTTITLDGTQTYTATSVCILRSGTLNLGGYDLTVGSFSSSGTVNRSIVFVNNNIILAHTTPATLVLSVADATNFSYSTVTGGFVSDASITRTYTFGTTGGTSFNAPPLSITSGTAIPTLTTSSWFAKLDFTGADCIPAVTTLNLTNLTLSSGGTFTNLSATMRSNGVITPNGKAIAALSINHTDPGTTTLAGAMTCTTQTYLAGNVDFANFNLTGSGAAAYTSGTFSNINIITCTTWTVTGTFVMYQGTITPSTSFVLTSGSITYNGGTLSPVGTFTHTDGTFILGKSYALTTTGVYTFSGGSISLSSYNLTTGSFISTNAVARSISFGTGNIILSTTVAAVTVLSMANATNFTTTGTGGFVSDASVARTFAFGTTGGTVTNAPNLSITSGADITTISSNSWFNKIDFTGSTGTPAAATVNVSTLILASGGTYTNLIPNFTRTQTWTAQFSKQLGGIGFNLAGGTLTLDNTQTYTATSAGSLSAGTIDLGGYDLTIGTFNSSTTNTRSIAFGGNYIILATTTAAATNLGMATATGFTYTGTGVFSTNASVTRTFVFGTTGGSATNSPSLLFTGSGTAVQTLTTGSWFNIIDFGSTAFNPGTTALNLNGLSLSPSGTFSALTPTFVGTGTITSNGNPTLPSITINHTGTTTLGSALTISLVGTTTLSSGTLALAGYTLTTGIFSSTGATARSISFDTGNITLAHTTAATTVLSMADTTNFTWTGTGGFTAAASITRTFTFGTSIGSATNAPNLSITSGAATPTITDNGWFKTLNFTGSTCTPLSTIYVDTLILATGGTYTSFMPVFTRTQTWTAQFSKQLAGIGVNGAGITLTLDNTQTYTATSNCRLSAGTIDLGGADLTIGTITSASTNTRAIAFGTNNIILATTTAAQTNLSFANATNFTYTGTGGFRAAADITRTFTFGTTGGSVTNAPNLTFTGSGTAAQTISNASYFKTLNFGTTAFILPGTLLNLTNLTLSSGGTFQGLTAQMIATGTITSNSNTTLIALYINGSGITTSLSSDLTLSTVGTTVVTLGTLNLNGFNLSTGIFNSNSTNTRSITFGTNNITLTNTVASTTVLDVTTATGFTYTGTGGFVADASIVRTYVFGTTGGSATNSPNLTFTGSGTAIPVLTTGSYFNKLDFGTTAFALATTTLNLNSLTLSASGTFTLLAATMVGTGTITSNARSIAAFTINHNGTTTLAAALSTTTADQTTLTSGTLDLAGFTLTTGIFSSTGTTARSISFGTGNITLVYNASAGVNLAIADATNFTYTGTGGFTAAMSVTRTFQFGSTTGGSVSNAPNLSLTSGASVPTITTGSWFKSLNFTGTTSTPASTTVNVDTLTLATGGTYTNLAPIFTRTQTWTSQFSKQLRGIGFNLIDGTLTLDSTQTYTVTSVCTLTAGTIDLGGYDLTIGTFSSNNTNTRSIYFGSNNIILSTTTASAVNIDMADASGCTFDGTGGFTTTATIARTFTVGSTSGSAVNAPNLSLTSGASIITFTEGSWFKALNFTGTTSTLTTTTINVDTLTLATGGTYTGVIPVFTRTQTWTPQFSKQLAGIGVNDSNATLTLENTQTYVLASNLIVNAGTLNLNGNALTFYYFRSTGTGSRSITGGGSITYEASWIVTNGSGFTGSDYTIYAQTSSFVGAGGTYGTLVSRVNTLTITGSNSFADIQLEPSVIITDPYFEYTTLLLPGTGTNGAQNNTFLDSSPNNLTVTRAGNTTQGTFTPYGANWSNYFDGTGDYLTVAGNTNLNPGTGDFTVEAWCNVSLNTAAYRAVYVIGPRGDDGIYYNGSNIIWYQQGDKITGTGLGTVDTWQHVAVTRSSGTTRLFVNGSLVGSYSDSYNYNYSSPTIGSNLPGSAEYFTGYISNVRFVKGTAVYTTTFTPSTTPLTAIPGTSLLTCQSNRLIDNSVNNFTITKNGNVTVQVFSPFSPASPYSTVSIGGSGYFDGSDYLSIANNAAFIIGANDASVELWVYSLTSTDVSFNGQNLGATSTLRLLQNGGNYAYTVNNDTVRTTSIPIVLNAWIHIALTITGGTARMFVNGILRNVATGLGSVVTKTDPYTIGCEESGVSNFLTGYMTDFRFVNGSIPTSYQTSSVTTGTTIFTPPIAPLSAIANTAILLNYTNAGIIDNTMINNVQTVGTAQISTAQNKFGGSSIAFPVTNDYIASILNAAKPIGDSDFTIEFWMYSTSATSGYGTIFNGGAPGFEIRFGDNGFGNRLQFGVDTTTLPGCYNTSFTRTSLLNTWTYIALVRINGLIKMYVNGTAQLLAIGTGTTYNTVGDSTALNFVGPIRIGTTGQTPGYLGYIEDFRITALARYTDNFTPPITSFPTS